MIVGSLALFWKVISGKAPDRNAQAAQIGKDDQTAAVYRLKESEIGVGEPSDIPLAGTKTGIFEIDVAGAAGRNQHIMKTRVSVNRNELNRQIVHCPDDATIRSQQKLAIRIVKRRQR